MIDFPAALLFTFVGVSVSAIPGAALAQQDTDSHVELVKAREKYETTLKTFESVQRLNEKGSASDRDLRQSELAHQLAMLALSDELDPAHRQTNEITKAKLILRYRSREWKSIERLHQRRSVSTATYRRAKALRDIARSDLRRVESSVAVTQKMMVIKIANSRLELIQEEYLRTHRLFETGSASRSDLDDVESRLKIAKAELAAARNQLGARAIRVTQ